MLVLCNNMCIDFESVRITATANEDIVLKSLSIALSPMNKGIPD